MNNNRIYKESIITLTVSASTTPTLRTNVTFFSYDIDTARQVIGLEKDGSPLSLDAVSAVTLVLQFAGRKNVLHLTPEIEDATQGILSIILPMQALGFDGEVTGGLFLQFENQQSLDCWYFAFNLRTSSIDHEAGDLADFYVQRFEEIAAWVQEKAEEILVGIGDPQEIVSHLEDTKIHITQSERDQWNQGVSAVDSVNGYTGVVVLTASDVGAAETTHSHAITDVTDLTETLAGKAPTQHSHEDYASREELAAHTADDEIHVSAEDREKWDNPPAGGEGGGVDAYFAKGAGDYANIGNCLEAVTIGTTNHKKTSQAVSSQPLLGYHQPQAHFMQP